MTRENHSVEKIGGTSMSQYAAVRANIILRDANKDRYQRIFVVSAYAGITDLLLEHKKSGEPGIYALFANALQGDEWQAALENVRQSMHWHNANLFINQSILEKANHFIDQRLDDANSCLCDLQRLCQHGHFALDGHLDTVREMLASLGEAHSAWNMTELLKQDGINACLVDLTGWRGAADIDLDERIRQAFKNIDLANTLPVVTGYAHTDAGLMKTFDRGYSEMTFSRIAVVTQAREAIIHKEFHLCSADPRVVGEDNAVPIGRTNYDVADQLANLGMEAIHPRAAKGLRQQEIPLRVKNTFEPEHGGTLITADYVSRRPCVEIIAGCQGVYAIELFDQDMMGKLTDYDVFFTQVIANNQVDVVTKDINANTITHYVSTSLKKVKCICVALAEYFPEAQIQQRKVAVVSAIGSDMQVPGILAKAVAALAEKKISVLAVHQSMRQVDIQFIIDETDYHGAVKNLHACLIEIHNHGSAICAA